MRLFSSLARFSARPFGIPRGRQIFFPDASVEYSNSELEANIQQRLRKMEQEWKRNKTCQVATAHLIRQYSRNNFLQEAYSVYVQHKKELFKRPHVFLRAKSKYHQQLIEREQKYLALNIPGLLNVQRRIMIGLLASAALIIGAKRLYDSKMQKDSIENEIFKFGIDDKSKEQSIQQTVRFDEIVGIDQYKQDLLQVIDFLKNPKKYEDMGCKLPKGILLSGPPGTGKTMIAKALANQANCKFIYKCGSEFDQMFVGMGSKRIRQLFKQARKQAPAIIFIDQIQSLARRRNAHDFNYTRDSINQFLTQLDGFKPSQRVIVLAATNYEQLIDPAVLRPGRFDKIIRVPLPDREGRKKIFQHYLSRVLYDKSISSQRLAQTTTGVSGAEIQNIINIAALNAVKYKRAQVLFQDFDYAIDRVRMGVGRKNLLVPEKAKLMTAYHEMGHALTALLTKGSQKVSKITILPRGPALGFTAFVPEEQMLSGMNKEQLLAFIDTCMGGRAAQQVFFGNSEVTSGCSSDLIKATSAAFQLVKELGMSQQENLMSIEQDQKISDRYQNKIDCEVDRLLKQSYNRVKNLLKSKERLMQTLSMQLLKSQTLDAVEMQTLLKSM